jgi:hypothetical protein
MYFFYLYFSASIIIFPFPGSQNFSELLSKFKIIYLIRFWSELIIEFPITSKTNSIYIPFDDAWIVIIAAISIKWSFKLKSV